MSSRATACCQANSDPVYGKNDVCGSTSSQQSNHTSTFKLQLPSNQLQSDVGERSVPCAQPHLTSNAHVRRATPNNSAAKEKDNVEIEKASEEKAAGCSSTGAPQHGDNTNREREDIEENSDESDFEEIEPSKTKRSRTIYSSYQLDQLELVFTSYSQYPNAHVREELSKRVGIKQDRIQVWFQNRRARQRRLEKTGSVHYQRRVRRKRGKKVQNATNNMIGQMHYSGGLYNQATNSYLSRAPNEQYTIPQSLPASPLTPLSNFGLCNQATNFSFLEAPNEQYTVPPSLLASPNTPLSNAASPMQLPWSIFDSSPCQDPFFPTSNSYPTYDSILDVQPQYTNLPVGSNNTSALKYPVNTDVPSYNGVSAISTPYSTMTGSCLYDYLQPQFDQ